MLPLSTQRKGTLQPPWPSQIWQVWNIIFRVLWCIPVQHCDEHIKANKDVAFQPVGSAIEEQCQNHKDAEGHYCSMQGPKIQVHWHIHNPAHEHRERHY